MVLPFRALIQPQSEGQNTTICVTAQGYRSNQNACIAMPASPGFHAMSLSSKRRSTGVLKSGILKRRSFCCQRRTEADRSEAVPGEGYGERLIRRKERMKRRRSFRVESILYIMSCRAVPAVDRSRTYWRTLPSILLSGVSVWIMYGLVSSLRETHSVVGMKLKWKREWMRCQRHTRPT
jgi:hypothetical protein